MAKILKQLMFGQKKNPPAPPRPDYAGNKPEDSKFADHLYANVSSFSLASNSSVHFQERKEENKLVVFQEYSEPADLRAEFSALADEEYGPLYMSPVDQLPRPDALSLHEEEMYSVPYEEANGAPQLPSPCLNTVGSCYRKGDPEDDSLSVNACYDTVAEPADDLLSERCSPGTSKTKDGAKNSGCCSAADPRPDEEYDEPWEWTDAEKQQQQQQLSIGLQGPPSSPELLAVDTSSNVEDHTYSEPAISPQGAVCESALSDSESCCEEIEDMTTRQRRLYETAFDSRVTQDIDDIDRLMQSPVLQGDIFRPRIKPGEAGPVLRTASRSSFGSTSGSSTSSTPTHQPEIVSKPSPRPRHYPLHLTPTERRKVTLIRDSLPTRSSSPLSRPIKVIASVEPVPRFSNRNSSRNDNRLISSFERQLSLSQWDSASRCSDKSSSSQESMDQRDDFAALSNRTSGGDEPRVYPLGKSASRDSISFRDSPSRNLNNQVRNKNIVESVSKLEDSPPFAMRKSLSQTGVKVLPIDNNRLNSKPLITNATSTTIASAPTAPQIVLSRNQDSPAHRPPNVTSSSSYDENVDKPPKPVKAVRPSSLVGNCQTSVVPAKAQTPENDNRPSDDYDPPWEFKSGQLRSSRVNGSQSVPECLSRNVDNASSETVVEAVKEEEVEEVVMVTEPPSSKPSEKEPEANTAPPVPKPSKPLGPPARPNLNLNLNLNSDSPRRARQGLTLNFGCAALSAVGEKVDAELTLEKQGWYHGSISRHDAENLLRVLKEGSYLVRNSESSKNDYSLSLRSARGFMHMKIVHTDGHFILGQFSNPFSSIPEMVHHYSINKLPIKGAEHMSLLYPVIDQLL